MVDKFDCVYYLWSYYSWVFSFFYFPPAKMKKDVKKLLCLLRVHDTSKPLNKKAIPLNKKRKGFVRGTLNATKILCNISKLI